MPEVPGFSHTLFVSLFLRRCPAFSKKFEEFLEAQRSIILIPLRFIIPSSPKPPIALAERMV